MRSARLLGVSLASLVGGLLGLPAEANAQIFIQPPRVHFRAFWHRPRVVFMPPAPVAPPPVYYYAPPAPPPVYVQPQQPCQPCQVMPPAPPPVYAQPAPLPAPPVYSAPAQPLYVQQPQPVYLPPPRLQERPQWRQRFGLGVRFAGVLNTDSIERSSQLGFGGELNFRVARHLALEVAGEYQRTVSDGFARFDVPITFGMRIHIGPPQWPVSPYFVIATGINYASLDFLHARDTAWFLEGQAGGGLEVRLGHRVGLTADVRGIGRRRMTAPSEAAAATTFVNGKPFHPMENQYGVQFRLGASVYF